jgi:hypothetical protein
VECWLVSVSGGSRLVIKFNCILFFIILISFNAVAQPPEWYGEAYGPAGPKVEPYFTGESHVYLRSDTQAEKNARNESCADAMRSIAKYFGVKVNVETAINTSSTKGKSETSFSQKIKEETGLTLFGLKPEKTKIVDEGKYHIRAYCLLVLIPEAQKRIQFDLERNRKIYAAEIKQLQSALIANELNRAKIHAAALKALPLLSQDDRLPALLSELNNALKGVLIVSMALNKKSFNVGDDVEITISLNQKANVYILMDTGTDWLMVYPNHANRIPMLQAGITELPTARMVNDGVLPLVYEEMSGKNRKLHLIASKKNNLLLENDSESDGQFEFLSYEDGWKQRIRHCISANLCVEQFLSINVADPLENISFSISGKEPWVSSLTQALRQQGMKISINGNVKIKISAQSKTVFSNHLNANLNQLVIIANLNVKNKRQKQLKVKRNSVVGADEYEVRSAAMSKLAEKVRDAFVSKSH